jgi:hypothetical protein
MASQALHGFSSLLYVKDWFSLARLDVLVSHGCNFVGTLSVMCQLKFLPRLSNLRYYVAQFVSSVSSKYVKISVS